MLHQTLVATLKKTSMQFENSYGILIFSDENYMLSPYFGYVRVK